MFDISQTEGKDLPVLTEVQGEVTGYRERLSEVRRIAEHQTSLLGEDRARKGLLERRDDHAALWNATSRGILHARA